MPVVPVHTDIQMHRYMHTHTHAHTHTLAIGHLGNLFLQRASPVAQTAKNLPAMWETCVRPLVWASREAFWTPLGEVCALEHGLCRHVCQRGGHCRGLRALEVCGLQRKIFGGMEQAGSSLEVVFFAFGLCCEVCGF